MPFRPPPLLLALLLALPPLALNAGESALKTATPEKTAVSGIRLLRQPQGGSALQTAELTYLREADGARVTLYGAVHLADSAYYGELNQAFKTHQALLFELVADPETAASAQAAAAGHQAALGPAYDWVGKHLGLQFQLKQVDYSAPNFVHADLSPSELSQAMKDRGESVLGYVFKAMAGGKGGNSGLSEADQMLVLMEMAGGKPNGERLKLIFAKQLAAADETLASLEGPKGSALISARNEAALRVMDAKLAGGARNLGIFYGAGHLPAFHQSLKKKGFILTSSSWRTAWKLALPAKPASPGGPATAPAPSP